MFSLRTRRIGLHDRYSSQPHLQSHRFRKILRNSRYMVDISSLSRPKIIYFSVLSHSWSHSPSCFSPIRPDFSRTQSLGKCLNRCESCLWENIIFSWYKCRNFGAVRHSLESGAMEWIAAEVSEVQVKRFFVTVWSNTKQAPWLATHPLHIEPDFRKKITR